MPIHYMRTQIPPCIHTHTSCTYYIRAHNHACANISDARRFLLTSNMHMHKHTHETHTCTLHFHMNSLILCTTMYPTTHCIHKQHLCSRPYITCIHTNTLHAYPCIACIPPYSIHPYIYHNRSNQGKHNICSPAPIEATTPISSSSGIGNHSLP